jgi:predicted nucleic acid-binding protein
VALLGHSLDGRFVQAFATDYVGLETTILTQRRLGADVSIAFLNVLRDSGIRTVSVGEGYYDESLELFRENFRRLSLCDAATVVIMNRIDIKTLGSDDGRSFGGLAEKVVGVDYYKSLPEKERRTKRILGK